ncbi:LemA family protein [Streptococcus cuniculi]|uniref:LemA family protein n=1 Tax=Streptococcus cuniculi TaxID=1432788 RepID=UPI001430B048|nr:LemA family protein [Streptococcus cuniculi]MBF0777407.1 LemA family protein [Streptococcus cuniculi]
MSIAVPTENGAVYEPFPGFILVAGLLTSLCMSLIMQYNHVRRTEQSVKSSKSQIQIVEERNEALLDKATRFVEKHQKIEKESVIDLNKSVSKVKKFEEKTVMKSSKIETSEEFGQFLREMPELLANKNVERLLDEIFETENVLAQWKMHYNNLVEEYNSSIHQFPLAPISKLIGLKEMEFYRRKVDVELTDEMLGL